MFCSKDVPSHFEKFTGKHKCQSLVFNKVAGVRPATLLKKRLWHKWLPVDFAKFSKSTFFTEHLWTTTSEKLPGKKWKEKLENWLLLSFKI